MFKLGGNFFLRQVTGLKICQLFTVLTGEISYSLKRLSQTLIGLVGTSQLDETHSSEHLGHFRLPIPVDQSLKCQML